MSMALTTITVSGMWFSTASIMVLCCSATNDTCRHGLAHLYSLSPKQHSAPCMHASRLGRAASGCVSRTVVSIPSCQALSSWTEPQSWGPAVQCMDCSSEVIWADLHAPGAANAGMRNVPIPANLIRCVHNDHVLLVRLREQPSHLPDHRRLPHTWPALHESDPVMHCPYSTGQAMTPAPQTLGELRASCTIQPPAVHEPTVTALAAQPWLCGPPSIEHTQSPTGLEVFLNGLRALSL